MKKEIIVMVIALFNVGFKFVMD